MPLPTSIDVILANGIWNFAGLRMIIWPNTVAVKLLSIRVLRESLETQPSTILSDACFSLSTFLIFPAALLTHVGASGLGKVGLRENSLSLACNKVLIAQSVTYRLNVSCDNHER